jgi:adenylate cyclase
MDAAVRLVRRALLWTVLAPVLPQVLGSWFNISYNVSVVDPLLMTEDLKEHFVVTCVVYNLIAYPIAVYLWWRLVYSIRPVMLALLRNEEVPAPILRKIQRRAINLPWLGCGISAVAWLLCIPVFLLALGLAGHPVGRLLWWHLPISFLVSALIAVTHSFFLVELASHSRIFPTLFRDTRPDQVGALTLSLRGRGVLWAMSAGICPIVSLLLLSFAPPAPGTDPAKFAMFVGTVGIVFGLTTAILISRLVAEPVDQLQLAAKSVASGRLDVHVPTRRADEFGLLIAEFNRMIVELREKEKLRQTFGLHVGRRAAEQILARDPGLGGLEQVITVMFVDIRGFTRRSAAGSAAETVMLLNEFLRVMVQVVEERHVGMVNKFLGDGFIAIFGIGDDDHELPHAERAVRAGREMLSSLVDLNRRLMEAGKQPLAIGIGIHTGLAIVGSVGSPQRLEFTAIGNTVNLASRVEGLTKGLGVTMLVTEDTFRQLRSPDGLKELPPQPIRGLDQPVSLYGFS